MTKAERKKKAQRRKWFRARIMRCKERRIKLLEALGGKCDLCPETDFSRLQFDHLNPREWVCRDKNKWMRMNLYEQEAAQGLIRILCGHCNKLRGKPREIYEENAGKSGSVLPGFEILT